MVRWNSGLRVACLMLMVASASTAGRERQEPAAAGSLRYRILAAEDARGSSPEELAPVFEGLASPDVATVRMAARAAGRLERPLFTKALRRALGDSDEGVRAEAANALAQVAGNSYDEVVAALRERLTVETDARVRGVIAMSLGRLSFKTGDERRAVEAPLVEILGDSRSSVDARLGAATGLDSLIRGARGTDFKTSSAAGTALQREALAVNRPGDSGLDARVRRMALAALNAAGLVDATHERAMFDRDPQVRRLAVAGMATEAGAGFRDLVLPKGLTDRDAMVRYEALRVYGRSSAQSNCSPELAAIKDSNPHVALLAIDQLATACPDDSRAAAALEAIVFGPRPPVPRVKGKPAVPVQAPPPGPGGRKLVLEQEPSDWRPAAHALVSLVRRQPAAGWAVALGALASHPVWQVRAYAARAAEQMRPGDAADTAAAEQAALLSRFAADANANVREAAIAALGRRQGHRADAIYLAALDKPDDQVVMEACAALRGTADRDRAAAALVRALAAISAGQRDTSRDPRLAILERLKEVAGAPHADALRSYLSDWDPRVAKAAAEVLSAITGQPHTAAPVRMRPVPLPGEAVLRGLKPFLRVTMASGRSVVVRLFVDDTPLTAWRIVRLVEARYYDGLTFHRIVPNMVVQGGSPGANEFVGDGPFMRDDTGLASNSRGTVGISTRGRDTGDAQIYINTVDNPRFDHTYAVFGEVIQGMDVVDLLVEGDVIRRIEAVAKAG